MNNFCSPLVLAGLGLLASPVAAQDLTNVGATITVQPGAVVSVGSGGLLNQAGATLSNAGTLRVDGPLTNAGTLDLGAGTLELKGDWANAGTLLPGTSPVTFSGPADQLLTPGGASLYQLLLDKPTAGANTLRLAGDLTLTNALTLTNGLLNTQHAGSLHTLRLPAGATLSGEASGRYVLGNLQITRNALNGPGPVDFGHGAVLDPLSNNLGAVAITRTAGLLTPDVSYGQNLAAPAYKGIDRIWSVAPATQPTTPVQLHLSWLADNDNGSSDFSQARAWQQSAPGQPWAPAGPVANASTRSISLSPTELSRFTVSNAANPLPVTLLDFAAQPEGPAAVRLTWATAQELTNAGFTVERSLNARTFTAIGTVAGAGTSAVRRDYALLDAQLPAGASLLYYRLRQTDLNGTLAYSPVRTVALTPQAAGFVVYPTRVAVDQAATYLYTGPAQPATLQVLDVLGRVLRTTAVDGRAQGQVPLQGLASGTYLLRYSAANAHFSARCVVE